MHRSRCASRLHVAPRRTQSTSASPAPKDKIFNTRAKLIQRERGARSPESASCDYIRDEVAGRLVDRLRDIQGHTFPIAVDYLCHAGLLTKKLLTSKAGIEHIYACDTSFSALKRDDGLGPTPFSTSDILDLRRSGTVPVAAPSGTVTNNRPPSVTRVAVAHTVTPAAFPFPPRSLDLVVSNLGLHWTDDLAGLVGSIHTALKPNGLFLGAIFGGSTLKELKEAFMVAEQEREGGISPHISPMCGVSDVGNVLTLNSFALTTVDTEEFKIHYADPFVLMHELRVMGEGNASLQRRQHTPRDTMLAAAAAYRALHGLPDGSVPATFQVIYFIGWVPHESHPKAKKRGSATVSLKDLAKVMGKQVSALEEIPDEPEPRK